MSVPRRFEMVEGSSSKFWEVVVEGATFTVTYGRIGTAGTAKTTTTASAATAAAEAEKLVREKLRKGYQELGSAVENWRPPAHIGTYERLARFMNYAVTDFDPNAEPGESEGRPALPALRELDRRVFAVGIGYDDADEDFGTRLDALLADPRVGELRGLVIGPWWSEYTDQPPTVAIEKLIAAGPKLGSLKGLFLGEILQEENEISWIHQTDLAPLLHALPQLEVFVVRGGDGLRFRGLNHASLRKLTVQSGGLARECVRDLAAAALPELRELTVWLGSDEYGGTVQIKDLAPILAGTAFPKLEHLGLQDSDKQDEIAVAVAGAPVLGRLKGLDLSMGTLSNEGGAALLAAPALRGLRHLNLRYSYLTDAVARDLRELGIEVDVSDRQTGDEEDRYVEVGE